MCYNTYVIVRLFITYIYFRNRSRGAVPCETDGFTNEELFNMQRGLTTNGHQLQQPTDEAGTSSDHRSTYDIRGRRNHHINNHIRTSDVQPSTDDIRMTGRII